MERESVIRVPVFLRAFYNHFFINIVEAGR